MKKVEIRFVRVSDAKRFYEMLNNPNFIYFATKPKSVEAEKKWLKESSQKRKKKIEYNFTILYDNQIAGGAGIKIGRRQNHIGELGYFVDEQFWSKGIATKTVKLLEKYSFQKLGLKRIEIRMYPKNKASVKVAIKAGYKKEGLLKKDFNANGKLRDSYLYAKVI